MKIFATIFLTIFITQQNAQAQNRFSDLFEGSGSAPNIEAKNPIANLGPFAVGYSFCQKLQALAPILQSYSTVMWPVIGIPGITTGMVQNESVLFKICDYLTQLQSLDTSGAIFHSARFLNDLTGKKWNDHLNQADLLWNTSNMIYDLRGNGGFRKGAMRSAYVHKALIDTADKTAKYYQKQNGVKDPEGIESRQERRRKLQRVAQLSYNRAILSEASSCPDAPNDKNYQKEYQTKVIPEQANIKRQEERIRFFQEQLMKMGADMYVDVSDLEDYKNDVLSLVNKGFGYRKVDSVVYVKREVPTGKLKAKSGDAPGMPEADYKDEKDPVPYQKISVIPNNDPWERFDSHIKKWDKFITSQFLVSGSFGLFDGKKGRIEEKYRNYAFECSEQQLAFTLAVTDRNNPRYYTELTRAQERCREQLKVRESEMKNLMENYVQLMRNDIRMAKDSQAKIWTFESLYLQTSPIIEDTPNNISNSKNEMTNRMKTTQASQESCRPQFTPGEMAKIDIELQNTNNALLEEVVKSGTERSINEDLERESKYKSAQKAQKKLEMDEQKILNLQEAGGAGSVMGAPDTSGSSL
jgi:hypothetical protein